MRVLLVEHESEEAQRMAQGLNEAGYSVEVAANGMVAQRLVEGNEYDLVILDVMLPAERLEVAAGDSAQRRDAGIVSDQPGWDRRPSARLGIA